MEHRAQRMSNPLVAVARWHDVQAKFVMMFLVLRTDPGGLENDEDEVSFRRL